MKTTKKKTTKKPATRKRATKAPVALVPVPLHQWTHTGPDVLIIKCVGKGGETYGGFMWPLTVGATVEAPDWNPEPECGGGLHGWPWGLSIGDGINPGHPDGRAVRRS